MIVFELVETLSSQLLAKNRYIRHFFIYRFGLIQMIVSTEEIPKGNEITVNYGYPFASGPLWYKLLMKKSIQKNPRLWRSDPNLYKLFENVNIFKWNLTNQYISLNLSNARVRKR